MGKNITVRGVQRILGHLGVVGKKIQVDQVIGYLKVPILKRLATVIRWGAKNRFNFLGAKDICTPLINNRSNL